MAKLKALNLVMKDDGFGFGDQVGHCPKCGNKFSIPIEVLFSNRSLSEYPCKYCGQLIKLN